jgi:hypothetical protein
MTDLILSSLSIQVAEEREPDFYPLLFLQGRPVRVIGRVNTPALAFQDDETGKEYRCKPVDFLTVEE